MNAGTAKRWILPAIWAALTLALALTIPRLPWSLAADAAGRALPGWIALAVLLNLSILPMWASEWTVLAPGRSPGFPSMLEIVVTSAAVLNSVPMLAGEASAVALLVTRAGLSRGAALSVLALDQLLVAFAKVVVLAIAVALSPVPPWVKAGMASLVVVFVLLATLLVGLSHRWETMSAQFGANVSRAGDAMRRALDWGRHLEVLRSPRRAAVVMVLALAKKGAEVGAAVAVQVALGMPPDFAAAVVVIAALALSTLVPIAPGNVGVYEATVYAVYRFFGTPAELALALAVVQHLSFLVPSVAPGYVMLTLRQVAPRWRRAG
jgi:uncharacterized protein (TIRG00374 family)